jgi:hypothetical protein
MDPGAIVAIVAILSVVASYAIRVLSTGRSSRALADLERAREQIQLKDQRLIDMERQNELLQQQIKWYSQLLESQTRRPAGQLGAPAGRLGAPPDGAT